MIYFNLLGRYGRLGNQMFQYASTLGIARSNGVNAAADISSTSLASYFKLGSVQDKKIPAKKIYLEKQDQCLIFDPFLMDFDEAKQEDVELRGYFQTEKYFSFIREEVLDNFDFNDKIKKYSSAWFDLNNLNPEKCVSVHVRRGDYLNLSDVHHNQSEQYYENALQHFKDYTPIVFSDDIDWCRKFFGEKAFYSINNEAVDMCLMKMCGSHIIANSSFSWWGAWLGGGPTIAPKKWFGPNGPSEWEDIYLSDWISL